MLEDQQKKLLPALDTFVFLVFIGDHPRRSVALLVLLAFTLCASLISALLLSTHARIAFLSAHLRAHLQMNVCSKLCYPPFEICGAL